MKITAMIRSAPLWQQIIIGLVLGVAAGLWLQEDAQWLKPLGTIFLNLIKMVIVPLVLFSLLSAITSMAHSGNLTRVGGKAIGLYMLTSLIAVTLGMAAASLFTPGLGVTLELSETIVMSPQAPPTILEMLLSIIPDNAIGAMAEGHILQLVVFSVFTGLTLNLIADKVPHTLNLIHELATLSFKMIELIVKLAPMGVFGYIGWLVGTQGTDVLMVLARFVGVVVGVLMVQFFAFGALIWVFTRLSPLPFYRKMIEPQILAFSTTSSKAALTTTMRALHEDIGVSKENTNFILPLGAAMNMDGTAVYLSICGLFFAQIYGIPLDWHHYLMLAFASTIASIGAAGIPSGSIIFMSMVLNAIGLPLEGIGLIIGVDRILDMFRTMVNITGDSAITLIVDQSEGTMDTDRYYAPHFEKKSG